MRKCFPQFLVCPFLRSASGASARTYLTYDPVETKHPQAVESYHNRLPYRYVSRHGLLGPLPSAAGRRARQAAPLPSGRGEAVVQDTAAVYISDDEWYGIRVIARVGPWQRRLRRLRGLGEAGRSAAFGRRGATAATSDRIP